MAPRRSNEGLLARVNFPLYSVEMLTSRHVLVAGGGGSSKTGVANGFVSIIQLFPWIFLFISNCPITIACSVFIRKSTRFTTMEISLLPRK